jgi:hypothetical protein
MRLRAQVVPAVKAPWCTILALVGKNPRVEVPSHESSVGYPLPPRFKLSTRVQRDSALVNREKAVAFTSLSATCRAPIIVSRAPTSIPTDELFVTVEASFPSIDDAQSLIPELYSIGGHIIRLRKPVAPATVPTYFSIQRWDCFLTDVDHVFPTTGFRSTDNLSLLSNQFLSSRPDTRLFCDWQIILGVIQQAYSSLPKRLNQFAFLSLPRVPSFFSRQYNVYREEIHGSSDLQDLYRTFVVDTSIEYIAWTTVPFDIISDNSCEIPVTDLVRPASRDPSRIPPPRLLGFPLSPSSQEHADRASQ